MAGRNSDLKVTIDADAAKLERALERSRRSMMTLEGQIRRTDTAAAQLDNALNEQRARAMEHMGRGMIAFGAATVVGLGLAAKAAVDWESAWTGVLKTVDGSDKQIARLERDLREMARTLPASHAEIAAVAEAAGQLGVATEDVAAFTKVMVDLGETTNLTADEAATSIAQLMNIMQTAPDDVDNLGAALVELGNNGASTERDIIEMAQRIAGAGAIVGLSEAEVLALANALASAGIEAEAGGSSISTAITKMASAVASGGEEVAGFAETAGMSSQQFIQAFERDPASAIQAFTEGLARIDKAGGNVFAVLDDLGLGSIRTRDALLRLATSGGLLEQSIKDGNRAWEENRALIEEAEKRYDTAEAKIQIAKNTLVDLAIDIGNVVLPPLTGLAETVADLFSAFGDLPGPIKTALTVLAAAVGVAALVGGAFLLLAPRIAAARAEMLLLARTAPVAYGALATLGQAAGIAAGVLVAAAAIDTLYKATLAATTSVADMTEGLLKLQEGETTAAIDRLIEKQKDVANRNWFENLTRQGFLAQKQTDELANEYEALDKALVGLVQGGGADVAEKSIKRIGEQLGLSGKELQRWIKARLPEYGEALKQVDNDTKLAEQSLGPLQGGLEQLATQFGLTGDDAAKAAQEMLDAWSEASTSFIDILGAYEAVLERKEERERETAENTANATKKTSDSWEDYVSNVSVSVDEYLDELERQVKAQQNWQANMLVLAGRVSATTLNELAKLGPKGAPLVQKLVNASDKELARLDSVFGKRSKEAGDSFAQNLAAAQPRLTEVANKLGANVSRKLAQNMARHGGTVADAARRLGIDLDKSLREGEVRKIPVRVTGADNAKSKIRSLKDAIKELPADTQLRIAANFSGHRVAATGGYIQGPGGPTDDKAGLWALSNGEFVMKAASVRKYGRKRFELMNAGLLPAEGGPVSRINIKASTSGVDRVKDLATDFSNKAASSISSRTGKVLPPGSYRVGRGPEGHGYNARDLPAAIGTPIFAAAAGLVQTAQRLAYSYGIHARISHGKWSSLYAHMSQMYVRAGQAVNAGQMIGRVGSTGNSTGPHLHLEPDNPRLYHNGGIVPGPRGRTVPILAAGGEGVFTPDQIAALGGRGGPGMIRAEDGSRVPRGFFSQPNQGRLAALLNNKFVFKVDVERDRIERQFEVLFDRISRIANKKLRLDLRADAKRTRHALMGWGLELERVHTKLDRARDRLKGLKSDARELRVSIREDIAGNVDLLGQEAAGTIQGRNGPLEVAGSASFSGIVAELTRKRDDARRFASVVEQLRRKGLGRRSLQQLIEAGPQEGMAAAEAILRSGKSGIQQINRLRGQLATAGNEIGKTAYQQMYRQGILAAQGLVRGLERRESRIRRVMRRIARSMVREIRHALRMRSPSRVLFDLAHDDMGGAIALGLDRSVPLVERSAASLAAAAETGARRWLVGSQNGQVGMPVTGGGPMKIQWEFTGRGKAGQSKADEINYMLRTGQLAIDPKVVSRR